MATKTSLLKLISRDSKLKFSNTVSVVDVAAKN